MAGNRHRTRDFLGASAADPRLLIVASVIGLIILFGLNAGIESVLSSWPLSHFLLACCFTMPLSYAMWQLSTRQRLNWLSLAISLTVVSGIPHSDAFLSFVVPGSTLPTSSILVSMATATFPPVLILSIVLSVTTGWLFVVDWYLPSSTPEERVLGNRLG